MPIRVITKIKPSDHNINNHSPDSCITIKDSNTVCIHKTDNDAIKNDMEMFKSHCIIPLEATPNQIYGEILLNNVNQMQYGQNTVFMCYGQHKSGKTHTLFADHGKDKDSMGLIFRAVQHILTIATQLSNNDRRYNASMRILRIYNDKLYDVLDNDSDVRIVDKRNTNGQITWTKNATVIPIQCIQDLSNVISKINKPGNIPPFNHVIYTFYLQYSNPLNNGQSKATQHIHSQMHFVEIASSDKLTHFMQKKSHPIYLSSPTKKPKHAHQQTNKFLHQTLESLVTVFTFMKQKTKFIPLRTTKLTHILKDCLNSKANITILLTIIPLQKCINETLKTLHFGEQIYFQCVSTKSRRKPPNKMKVESSNALPSDSHDDVQSSDNIIQLLHEMKELICCPNNITPVDIENMRHRIADMMIYLRHNNQEMMQNKNAIHRLQNENEMLREHIAKQNQIINDWRTATDDAHPQESQKMIVDSKINDIEHRLKQHTSILQSLQKECVKNMDHDGYIQIDDESSELRIPSDMFDNITAPQPRELEKVLASRPGFEALYI